MRCGAGVRGGETDKRGPCEWIEMRSALAHQVRRPERAFGAGWNGGGFVGHAFIGIATVIGSGAKAIAEPAQRKSGGLRHSHNVPAAGDGVTESVQAAFGIERRTIRGGKNHAGSSDGGADHSGARDAHADGSSSLIACAGNHRSSRAKTSCICASLRKLSANILRFEKFWEQLHVNASFGEDFARPRAVGDVEHQCSGSVGDVNGGFAGEAQADVVLRQHDFADALPVFRFVLADPEKFGEREICQRRIAGQLDDAVEADGALEFFGLRFGALVTPNQSGTNDFVIFVEQDGAMHLAGKADGGDGLGGEA